MPVLLPLPSSSGSGFLLHLLADLTDYLQAALFVSQVIRQVATQVALAVLTQ